MVDSCQHGHMEDHDKSVLMSVVKAQQTMIQAYKRDIQTAEDSAEVFQMRIGLLTENVQYYQSQMFIYHMLGEGDGPSIFGPDFISD